MSLYEQMKKNSPMLFKVGKEYVAKSHLLEDVKAGKEPEKKHVTLDNFLKDSSMAILVES